MIKLAVAAELAAFEPHLVTITVNKKVSVIVFYIPQTFLVLFVVWFVLLCPSQQLSGIFLGLIWGRISAPSQFKNEQKLPKAMYIIIPFLVLHFSENFIKIQTKIAKLQMHEILHKNVNENMFSFTFL